MPAQETETAEEEGLGITAIALYDYQAGNSLGLLYVHNV